MIRPRKTTEDLLFSITKNSKTLIKQIHAKPQGTFDFILSKSRETFSFTPSDELGLDSTWMIGLTSLEVYSSIFNITEHNNKFELYRYTFDEISFEELKEELEEILDVSSISPEHIQDERLGPRINSSYKKLDTEKRQSDG